MYVVLYLFFLNYRECKGVSRCFEPGDEYGVLLDSRYGISLNFRVIYFRMFLGILLWLFFVGFRRVRLTPTAFPFAESRRGAPIESAYVGCMAVLVATNAINFFIRSWSIIFFGFWWLDYWRFCW